MSYSKYKIIYYTAVKPRPRSMILKLLNAWYWWLQNVSDLSASSCGVNIIRRELTYHAVSTVRRAHVQVCGRASLSLIIIRYVVRHPVPCATYRRDGAVVLVSASINRRDVAWRGVGRYMTAKRTRGIAIIATWTTSKHDVVHDWLRVKQLQISSLLCRWRAASISNICRRVCLWR